MTPYELSLFAETYYEKKEIEMQDKVSLVWLGEYYHRTKRLPNLKNELKKITRPEKTTMSDKEMLEKVKLLNAQFGGTIEKS